jgi:hypothetical protein
VAVVKPVVLVDVMAHSEKEKPLLFTTGVLTLVFC